jgi:hypothetical protein
VPICFNGSMTGARYGSPRVCPGRSRLKQCKTLRRPDVGAERLDPIPVEHAADANAPGCCFVMWYAIGAPNSSISTPPASVGPIAALRIHQPVGFDELQLQSVHVAVEAFHRRQHDDVAGFERRAQD